MGIYYNANAATGTFDGLTATDVAGNAVQVTDGTRLLLAGLSALVTLDVETNTMTVVGRWQVSSNNSTWVDCDTPNNAAEVTIGTGTAGADAAITKAISAPEGVYGVMFARYVITNGVAAGNTVDTYSIGYNYREPGFETF
jgi:hypothetical protein